MITELTMQVLKNYASINPNIVIESGNVIKTISEAKNQLARLENAGDITSGYKILADNPDTEKK